MDKISFDQIQQITIAAPCIKTSPCKHKCEIVLTDGRKKSVTLSNASIGSLIEKVSKEKIDYQGQIEHFSFKKPISPGNPSKHTHIKAEEILNKLFDETTSEASAEKQSLPLTQIQSKNEVKSNASSFFNRRNILILAGVTATVAIAFFGLYYAQQVTEASREAAELAKQAANLQRSCVVTNQGQSFVGSAEQIAKCGLQMFANTDDIKINCNPQFVQEAIAKFASKNDLFCDETIKNNFNGDVIVSQTYGQDHLHSDNLSGSLMTSLGLGFDDLTITLNKDRVNEWANDFNTMFEPM